MKQCLYQAALPPRSCGLVPITIKPLKLSPVVFLQRFNHNCQGAPSYYSQSSYQSTCRSPGQSPCRSEETRIPSRLTPLTPSRLQRDGTHGTTLPATSSSFSLESFAVPFYSYCFPFSARTLPLSPTTLRTQLFRFTQPASYLLPPLLVPLLQLMSGSSSA